MTKGVKTSDTAAYEVFLGVTAKEAAEKGYVVVENSADGVQPVYGRYLDTATGAALETLVAKDERVAVPAGGERLAGVQTPNKGSLLNINDPVVHGVADNNPHADGAEPNDSENKDLKLEGYTPGDDLKAEKPKKS